MRATRRNVLVILGVLTIAGGALFGTGAFTQVEAQRSVSVETADDSQAQLGLAIEGSLSGGDGEIQFEESDLNQNATTFYNGSLVITNQNSDTTISNIDIETTDGTDLVGATDQPMYFVERDGTNTTGGLANTESVSYDVVFNTEVEGGSSYSAPENIVIRAEE